MFCDIKLGMENLKADHAENVESTKKMLLKKFSKGHSYYGVVYKGPSVEATMKFKNASLQVIRKLRLE